MMNSPPHPGFMIKSEVLEALDLKVTDAARKLGMSRVALSRIVNGRAGISADLAIRLESAGISTARFWLALQMNYDLAQARTIQQPPIEKLRAA
jgi:antitoxin HigA-1